MDRTRMMKLSTSRGGTRGGMSTHCAWLSLWLRDLERGIGPWDRELSLAIDRAVIMLEFEGWGS